MKIHETLETMLDILEEKDWIQGDLFAGPHGERGDEHDIPVQDVTGVCLAGAHKYGVLTGMLSWPSDWIQMSQFILDVARDLYPERVSLSIPHFNDNKHTTIEDVRLVLKTAIEKASE